MPTAPAAGRARGRSPLIRAVPSAPSPRTRGGRPPAPARAARRRPARRRGRAAGPRPRRAAAREPGRGSAKRQETRARIVDAAAELFAERGFDAVSVMEIARRAGVVEKTVFNHFPVKEGLVFDADPPMRAALLDAVRRRPAGESVSAAAGSFVVAAVSLLGSPEAADGRRATWRGSSAAAGRCRCASGRSSASSPTPSPS